MKAIFCINWRFHTVWARRRHTQASNERLVNHEKLSLKNWGLQKISGLMVMHHFKSLWPILVHFYRDSKFPRPEILIFSPEFTFEGQHSCISPALRTQITRRFVCYCSNSEYTRYTIMAAVNKWTTPYHEFISHKHWVRFFALSSGRNDNIKAIGRTIPHVDGT